VDKDRTQLKAVGLPAASRSLSFAPTRVLSPEQRKQMALSDMLDRNIHDRVFKILEAERRDWESVKTLRDWESFRDPKLKALAASMGEFPQRQPLETRIVKQYHGDGYQRQDLVY
jgi:hypothetical protein